MGLRADDPVVPSRRPKGPAWASSDFVDAQRWSSYGYHDQDVQDHPHLTRRRCPEIRQPAAARYTQRLAHPCERALHPPSTAPERRLTTCAGSDPGPRRSGGIGFCCSSNSMLTLLELLDLESSDPGAEGAALPASLAQRLSLQTRWSGRWAFPRSAVSLQTLPQSRHHRSDVGA